MICLKNRTFAVSQTTAHLHRCLPVSLWFAWKIVLLQYHKQQTDTHVRYSGSCDLLEKSYFCSITNNDLGQDNYLLVVVICLKNRTFAVSQTTVTEKSFVHFVLWFAWKIVLLQYHKQHEDIARPEYLGCDLLEKSYFCSITNNLQQKQITPHFVVICLKNRTFAVSQTT